MNALLKQTIRFIGFSGIGWLIDFVFFTVLSYITKNSFLSNVCSSLVGASFVFIVSLRHIFKNRGHFPLVFKYIIYTLYQLLQIYIISKLLDQINLLLLDNLASFIGASMSAVIAKIIVTPITMSLNFIVMKGVIEKM